MQPFQTGHCLVTWRSSVQKGICPDQNTAEKGGKILVNVLTCFLLSGKYHAKRNSRKKGLFGLGYQRGSSCLEAMILGVGEGGSREGTGNETSPPFSNTLPPSRFHLIMLL